MPPPHSPEAYREILLPRRSRGVYDAYEAMTEPEVRTAALAVLQNPVFQFVLVDLQEQVISSIKLTASTADLERHCLTLAAIDLLLGAVIGQAFETRDVPSGE